MAVILPPTRRAIALGLAAALSAPAILRAARAQAPLKIGCLAPVSGFFAREGQNCKRGFDLAGPMLADMGLPVEIVFADTESNPDRARTAAERLLGEGAQLLIGTFDSGETSAVAQVPSSAACRSLSTSRRRRKSPNKATDSCFATSRPGPCWSGTVLGSSSS